MIPTVSKGTTFGETLVTISANASSLNIAFNFCTCVNEFTSLNPSSSSSLNIFLIEELINSLSIINIYREGMCLNFTY